MFNVYSIEEVVSKLPLEANSISNYGDTLLIGSKQGHLICCSQTFSSGHNIPSYDYQVCRSFERRQIINLSVIESLDKIICLTDTHLSIHEAFAPYRLISSITKYKQILCFAHLIQQNILYILISIKNRLIIFQHLEEKLEEIGSINFDDSALRILWCQSNSLFISTKLEHYFAKLTIIQTNGKESFNQISISEFPRLLLSIPPRSSDLSLPISACLLSDKQIVALNKDEKNLEFFDLESGGQTKLIENEENYCQFTDGIVDFVYDSPYILAILCTNCIEIRLITPSVFIQKINLNKVFMLNVGRRGSIYAANDTQAWKLNTQNKLRDNLKFLNLNGHHEIALQIANVYSDVVDEKEIVNLKKSIAAKSFSERKFSKCFDIHAELKTDLLFIINLFPKFLPEKYSCSTEKFINEIKLYGISNEENSLDEEEVNKKAVDALIKFISMKRQEHSKPINLHFLDYKEERKENILSTNSLKRHEIALELIDTVLLKAYLMINPKLIGPLLRLKNCCCIISEAEKDLKKAGLFEELLILYERKKIEVKKPEASTHAHGIEKIATFLMKLKSEQLSLILEFSPIVLAEDIELGVKIFTGIDSSVDAKNFDRDSVLQFLKRQFPAAVIPYLEHIIYEWEDKRPKFHEELVLQYITRIKSLLSQFVKLPVNNQFMRSLSSNDENIDNNELVILRRKLRAFLETDKYYTVKDTLKLIEKDEVLADEQAILYGRLGQHKEALSIYTNKLVDFAAAERHCLIYYNENDLNNSQIFYNLFCSYVAGGDEINRKKSKENGERQIVAVEHSPQKRPNITEALKLLRRHANKINIVKAFALIPSETPLSRIDIALKAVFETLCTRLTMVNLLMALTQIAINRTEINFKLLKQQRININESVVCFMCKKRIMESAFVRHRFDSISHFFCHRQNIERIQKKINAFNEHS
uniref:CNH domain-containing protein n=1 Tax=Meloidogyne incognita TaxID=6306 RepID=A0A914N646_MELIC